MRLDLTGAPSEAVGPQPETGHDDDAVILFRQHGTVTMGASYEAA